MKLYCTKVTDTYKCRFIECTGNNSNLAVEIRYANILGRRDDIKRMEIKSKLFIEITV